MNNYIYPSANSKGEGTRVTVRIPPELHRMLMIYFDMKKWPYLTFSDEIRHALFRHAEWLDNQDTEEHGMTYLRAMVNMLNTEEQRIQFARVMGKMRDAIEAHVEHGDMDDASRVVTTILGAIKGMPEGGMRDRYEEEIRKEYGELVGEVVEMVSLVDLDPSKAVEE